MIGRSSLTLLAVVAAGALLACGDDDDGGSSDLDGGLPGDSGGPGGGAPAPGITPLGDDVAGKACDGNEDCDGALCATQITGTGLAAAPAPGGYCTGPCQTEADCGRGGACIGALGGLIDGQCFAACESTDDCRDGYLCGGGFSLGGVTVPSTCRPAPETDQLEDDVAGRECDGDDDCGGGSCATTRGGFMGQGGSQLPGGYCTGRCLQDAECGAGGLCVSGLFPGSAGSCYEACSADADCARDGYRCRQVGMEVLACDAAPDPLPDNSAGDPCGSDADCGGAPDTCADTLPAGGFGQQRVDAPGGYCSQGCSEQSDCGAGGACVGGFGFGGAGTCYSTCTSDGDCREDYSCQSRGGNGGTDVCVPTPPDDADAG